MISGSGRLTKVGSLVRDLVLFQEIIKRRTGFRGAIVKGHLRDVSKKSRCSASVAFIFLCSAQISRTHSDIAFPSVHDIQRVLTAGSEQADLGVVALERCSVGFVPRRRIGRSRAVGRERVRRYDLGQTVGPCFRCRGRRRSAVSIRVV